MKITHDLHIHTHLSLCAPNKTGTVANYIESAKKQGLLKLGFTDHFWGGELMPALYHARTKSNPTRYYRVQNFEYISQTKKEFHLAEGTGIQLLFGAEAEYNPYRRTVAIEPWQAEQMDFVIVPNSHTHMMMPRSLYQPVEKHIDFMFRAFYDIINCPLAKYVTSIAHPFHAVACPYGFRLPMELISDDRYKFAFDAAAEKGIAIEINLEQHVSSDPKPDDYYEEDFRMFAIAKECGCKFTFGSDSHTLAMHKNCYVFDKAAERLGLCEDDIAEKARV